MDKYSMKVSATSDLTAAHQESGFDNMVSTAGATVVESGPTISDGKLDTFLRIAEQRRAQLTRMAQRMTNNLEDAEDIVQEALLRAFKNLPQFRGESQMGTWLCVIVQNVGRERLRKQKGQICLPLERARNGDNDPLEYDFPDPGRNPEQSCENGELEKILLSEIERMNSVCKRVLQMCGLEELSQQNVASTLGISVFTVKSRFYNGRKILKRAVSLRLGTRCDLSDSRETTL